MARRRQASDKLIGLFILLAIPIALAKSAYDAINNALPPGWTIWHVALIACAAIALLVLLRRHSAVRSEKLRVKALMCALEDSHASLVKKYKDQNVVNQIIIGRLWQDMTKEQLVDAWGFPDDIETKVMKSKIREIYKFGRIGVNRFVRRATLENDLVVGWEEK